MNITEAASYLLVSDKTIKRWIRQKKLPKNLGGGFFGNDLVFSKADLDAVVKAEDSFKCGQLGFGGMR